jgi:DNA-binding GntR family transcriptional regulator
MDLATQIRDLILAGELVPNQRLVEGDISAQFGVSRPAVREALRELAGEGLVERVENRGSRVRAVSFDEAIEIALARRALESLCAGKAAEVVTDREIDELRRLARDMEEAVATGDVGHYSAMNRRLHARIHEISQLRIVLTLISRLRAQSVRQQFRLATRPGRPRVSVREHVAIIDAICARDPHAAERAMAAHLDSVIAAMHESRPGASPAGGSVA